MMLYTAVLTLYVFSAAAAPSAPSIDQHVEAPGEHAAGNSFDFDLMAAPTAPADSKVLSLPPLATQKAVAKRRTMLKTHQVLGLTTLGLMATTVILGQLNYSDLYGRNGGKTGNYLLPHQIGAYATTGAFVATASFSLFAPNPYARKRQGIDTAILHKTAVGVATAGMVTQIVLGFITARSADSGNADHLAKWAKAHQAVGYTTFGALATAATVWIF